MKDETASVELTVQERRQRDAEIWRRFWEGLTPERRAELTRRRLEEIEKREAPARAMEDWQAAAWRASASSPFHESMRDIAEINLAVRAAGATGEALPDYPPAPEHENGSGFDSGRVFPLGDAEDGTAFPPVESTPDFQFAARIIEETMQTLSDQTGIVEEPDRKAARDRERATLKAQSHKIAGALESQGVEAYRNSAWQAWRVYVHTQHVETVPPFRNITLLPYVAARNRQNLLAGLEWFLQRHPFCRFWTFTTGPRCPVAELADRVAWLHRRLSQLNAAPFMVEAGVQLVFRATEFGTLEEKPGDVHAGELVEENGVTYYHPHAHCVAWLSRGTLPRWQWVALGDKIKRFWRHHWDGGEIIGSARECVKYVSKPGDMVRLAVNKPGELRRLYEALRGVHLVQPLGELRLELSAMRKAGLELSKQWTRDGIVWQLKRSLNRSFLTGTYSDAACKDRKHLVAGVKASLAAWQRLLLTDQLGPQKPETAEPDVCRVVSISAPVAGPLNVREPVVYVLGTRLDLAAVMREPVVADIIARTREDFAAGLALARVPARASGIRVHTGTTTVLREHLPGFHDVPERVRPAEKPVWSVPVMP